MGLTQPALYGVYWGSLLVETSLKVGTKVGLCTTLNSIVHFSLQNSPTY